MFLREQEGYNSHTVREHSPIIQQLLRGWQQPRWLNWLLLPLSLLNSLVMRIRRLGYRYGIFQSTRPQVPVIVVGNLSAGGTGKSPLVAAIAGMLTGQGWRPGVISRGYGGSVGDGPLIVTEKADPALVGDEPRMLFESGLADIAVGRKRTAAAELLVAERGCDIIVSDDGFQHLQLARDIDIVVIDGPRGLGNGWCLPSGPLRESPAVLALASIIVVNGEPNVTLARLLDQLAVPQSRMKIRVGEIHLMDNAAERRSLDAFQGVAVSAVAGLGNPDRFFATLERAGLDVTPIPFRDHHRYSASDFAGLDPDAPIMMTEKDAVKCRLLQELGELPPEMAGRVWVVPIEAELDQDFTALLNDLLASAA